MTTQVSPRERQVEREIDKADQVEKQRRVQEQITREDANAQRAADLERERVTAGRKRYQPRLKAASVKVRRDVEALLADHRELVALYAEANALNGENLAIPAHLFSDPVELLRCALPDFIEKAT